MEPWPSFSLMLRTHTLALKAASFTLHLSHFTSRPQLRLCTALLLPALPKVHSDAEGGLLNLPQSLVIMLAMPSFFLYPLRATVHHYHMFSSSSPPTYIASISRFGSSPYQHAPASDPLAHVDEKVAQLRCAFYVFMPSSLSG